MTDWSSLVVPGVRDLEPLDVEATVAEVRALHRHERAAKLDWNENLFGPLPGVLEEVGSALTEASHYPIDAYDAFRRDVARHLGVDPRCIVPGHGIQSLLGTLATVFLRPGDRVVAPDVTYYLFALVSAARGAAVERVPLRGYALDLEALARAAGETEARLVWVCDPNNPTGTALSRAGWEAFLDELPEGAVVVADEAYADFLPPERRLGRERDVAAGRPVIVLRTFSKLYGLAGLRIGYAIVDEALAPYLAVVDEPFNVSCAALAAGRASLRADTAAGARRREVTEARALLTRRLHELGLEPYPSETSFVLARVDTDDVALARELAGRGVLVRPGTELGLQGHVRVTVGPPPVMERVAGELGAVLAR